MVDDVSIGPTPSGEDCAQVGDPNYRNKAMSECRAFVNQLRRKFGEPPPGTSFRIKRNPHDFGEYFDVVVVFTPDNEESVNYAFKVEAETPEYWDFEARQELGLIQKGRPEPRPDDASPELG